MVGLFRFTAIAVSVLVFALVLTVCAEAGACGGCVDGCCLKTDRGERRRDIVAHIVKACSKLVPTITSAFQVAVLPTLDRTDGRIPPLLASTVAPLRV